MDRESHPLMITLPVFKFDTVKVLTTCHECFKRLLLCKPMNTKHGRIQVLPLQFGRINLLVKVSQTIYTIYGINLFRFRVLDRAIPRAICWPIVEIHWSFDSIEWFYLFIFCARAVIMVLGVSLQHLEDCSKALKHSDVERPKLWTKLPDNMLIEHSDRSIVGLWLITEHGLCSLKENQKVSKGVSTHSSYRLHTYCEPPRQPRDIY